MGIEQSVRESGIVGFRIFQTMLSDFIEAMLRLTQDKTVSISQKAVEKVFAGEESFQEKAVKMHSLITNGIKDPETREYYLKQLDNLIATEKTASQGIDSMIRFVRRSTHLSEETKNSMIASFTELKKTHQQAYARTLTESQYRQLVSILKEKNLLGLSYEQASTIGRTGRDTTYDQEARVLLMNNIHMLKSSDGLYHLIYEGERMNEMMNLLIKQAALNYHVNRSITKDEYDAMRMARRDNASMIADIKLEGLNPVFAEKIIRQGEKDGTTLFIPEKQQNGTITLYTDAGPQDSTREAKEKRDMIYTNVNRIVAGAAYSLTGEGGKYEAKRMTYFINRQEKLNTVLHNLKKNTKEQQIFIMFPRAEQSSATNGEKRTYVDQFLMATANSLSYVQSNGAHVDNVFKKPSDVTKNIEQIVSGKENFFILTDQDMAAFRKTAISLETMMHEMIPSKEEYAKEKVISQLKSKVMDVDAKLYDLRLAYDVKAKHDAGERSVYRAQTAPLQKEKSDLFALMDAINKSDNKIPTSPDIIDSLMSVRAEQEMFKQRIPKNVSQLINAENQMLYNGLQEFKGEQAKMTNPIIAEPFTVEKEHAYKPKEAYSILHKLKDNCIASLSEISVPNGKTPATKEERENSVSSKWPVDKDAQGNVTVNGVKEVTAILDKHVTEATKYIEDHVRITSRFLQPDLSVDLLNRTSSIEIEKAIHEETQNMDIPAAETHTRQTTQDRFQIK